MNGLPAARYVCESRTIPGHIDVERVAPELMDALTRPLTAEEQKRGRWEPPADKRILFEGTLEKAQDFYEQVEIIPSLQNAPFALYTDGLPVRVPTEERVAEMLKGTSHKPDELIVYHEEHFLDDRQLQMGNSGKLGEPVVYLPMKRTATVEKIATIAVMAGCKPEYFPVVLAMAESGGGTGDGRGGGGAFMVSGPIYKEIGMNVTNFIFGPGNPVNKTLGRVGSLMWRNLGGYEETITTITTLGNPVTNGGFFLAEYAEGLPPGWKGLNEELGFKKDESVLMPLGMMGGWGIGQQHAPGVYRSLQRTGHGAMARFLGVKGIPGPHNYLVYLIKDIWATMEGGFTLVMPPQIARDLYDYGFKTKQSIYEWIWKQSFEPVSRFRMRGSQDFFTNGWLGIEKTSGKPWRELPDDYMVPVGGDDPFNSYNIVVINMEETAPARYSGGHGQAYSIDAWR